MTQWLYEMTQTCEEGIKVVLIGSKLDLVESSPEARKVDSQEAENFAKLNYMDYFECSAFTAKNVDSAFLRLLHSIFPLLLRRMNDFALLSL